MADTITVRIPRTIYDDLAVLARKQHRSINGEATVAVEKHIDDNRHVIDAARQEAGR